MMASRRHGRAAGVMTATTRDLARQAQAIAARSEGLRRVAANCAAVACSQSPSIAVARQSLEGVGLPDVRRAALRMLDELAAAQVPQ